SLAPNVASAIPSSALDGGGPGGRPLRPCTEVKSTITGPKNISVQENTTRRTVRNFVGDSFDNQSGAAIRAQSLSQKASYGLKALTLESARTIQPVLEPTLLREECQISASHRKRGFVRELRAESPAYTIDKCACE
ncbi:hypothetical protein F443_16655, partial [Phytophthora nicotianae P1569]